MPPSAGRARRWGGSSSRAANTSCWWPTRHSTPDLRCKVGASDLVQDTFLEAHRDFHQFRGKTAQELLGWLRRILLHNVANSGRRHRSPDTRSVLREVPLGDLLPDGLPGDRVVSTESPSDRILLEERDLALEQALDMLPEQYRRVIVLRNHRGRSFAQIGEELGRTAEASRKVWARAVVHLQNILEPAHAPRQPSHPG